ncbi:magnesium-translocating P-type ATPase [Mycoplasma tauri]|uniref:Magnesium-transporting ATPase, P-type 1 n=1 Tax=Mycoplasma tauri TaxID=547987 RepID=A0A953NDH0_9MOLU|nr:magnesium-translocating P-type ATPase [Mycoplasma tauri]MBZ4195484.1 magnesium-translocating P-type ATPase [Mycoplasma tauri]MBZ4203432.1 magnesium-translocating P-type ATPase [Mycoplasma tauri]MBZ4212764.1 magnesium-translocating P-type ATPase [Mycoplasma tauri]
MKKNNLKNSTNDIQKELIINSKINVNELYSKLNSSQKGITNDDQIEENREKFGKNSLSKKNKNVILKRIIEAFFNPFSIILMILSLISLIMDVIIPLSQDKNAEPATIIIIMSMVLVSGILHAIEDSKNSSSASKLIQMVQTTTKVERNGVYYEIPLDEVVVGDIVILAAGDIIPADLRILSAKDLFVSQASLTGESEPVEKFASSRYINTEVQSVTDLNNVAFMGSNIISGSAKAIVIVTGDNTYLGQVAKKINEKPAKTSFEKGINAISWLLFKIMISVVPIVFLIVGLKNYSNGHKWIEALMFAISVAVGLTPEMLPMIVTSTLAKGATKMSKKKTIVKSLNSIQNFGAMDVFCTDKTGTLTLDQVVLQMHLDVLGHEDFNVLKYGFLNSYYQTGLKNLLDLSILNKTEELSDTVAELRNLETVYKKIDEIPFDFNRKRMTVLVKNKNSDIEMVTKGAVEEILSVCAYLELNNEIKKLDKSMIDKVLKQVDKLNDQGMRVIAVARKKNPSNEGKFSVEDEKDMTLIGYLAFLDPPKESTASAIKNLYELGVDVKILTGDNARVTKAICDKVGIPTEGIILGKDLIGIEYEQLKDLVNKHNIFAKLSPNQKADIIQALKDKGHVVGYMGDGINDAPAMKAADVSISVDTAVDIAKESANIILLEKDLNVLATGIVEGRKTYANMNKYIKMTISSNFGNIFSILIAAILLPFVPLAAAQILFMNLVYDIACGTIPWDNVDKEFIKRPRQFNIKMIVKFMLWFGPVSSIIDILAFILLNWVFIPQLYPELNRDSIEWVILFQTGWFVISMWTQSLIIHFIRTEKIPFIQSRSSILLFLSSFLGIALVTTVPYIPGLNVLLKVKPLNPWFYLMMAGLVLLYITLVMIVKLIYKKIYKEIL